MNVCVSLHVYVFLMVFLLSFAVFYSAYFSHSDLFLFYLVLLYYYFLDDSCFLMREIKGVDPDWGWWWKGNGRSFDTENVHIK